MSDEQTKKIKVLQADLETAQNQLRAVHGSLDRAGVPRVQSEDRYHVLTLEERVAWLSAKAVEGIRRGATTDGLAP